MAQEFEVFRMEKLKDAGAICRSLRHDLDLTHVNENGETVYYRKTRNAEKIALNGYMYSKDGRTQEEMYQIALKKWREKLPEKYRTNAVLGAQLIFSFSHEKLADKNFKVSKYVLACNEFVKQHFGADNIFNWSIHMDETTPHLTYQFVPKINGKLNARKIFGNKKTLSEWQDKFHAEVGEKFGLARGVKKTNICHDELRTFYGRLKNLDRDLDKFEIEKKPLTESWDDYASRLKNQLKEFVSPMLKPLANMQAKIIRFEKEKSDFELARKKEAEEVKKEIEKGREELEKQLREKVFQELSQENARLKNLAYCERKTKIGNYAPVLYQKLYESEHQKNVNFELLSADELHELADKKEREQKEQKNEKNRGCWSY